MAKHKVQAIGHKRVRGGVEVTAYGRTDRGTRYIVGSVVCSTDKLDKEAKSAILLRATESLLS